MFAIHIVHLAEMTSTNTKIMLCVKSAQIVATNSSIRSTVSHFIATGQCISSVHCSRLLRGLLHKPHQIGCLSKVAVTRKIKHLQKCCKTFYRFILHVTTSKNVSKCFTLKHLQKNVAKQAAFDPAKCFALSFRVAFCRAGIEKQEERLQLMQRDVIICNLLSNYLSHPCHRVIYFLTCQRR